MKTTLFTVLCLWISFVCKAQSGPVMYFCENYKHNKEVKINSTFTTGNLTVMVKSPGSMNLTDVVLEFEKYDSAKAGFVFYKKFDFSLSPEDNYICFSKTKENDLAINEPGFYRVALIGQRGEVATSALVQIVATAKKL